MEKIKFSLKEEDFLFLNNEILGMGYSKITKTDFKKTFSRLNLTAPRKLEGKETSYRYTNNGYTVILHTTYLESQKKWRDKGKDIGWNLIIEGDEEKYFARPFQRTKNFIVKFLRYAWISKWKVDHRHLCRECSAYMDIYRKKGTRQYFWTCWNKEKHSTIKPIYLSWDYNLPPKAMEFVDIRRKNTRKYIKKIKKEGKTVIPSAIRRKKWIIGNPDNKIN